MLLLQQPQTDEDTPLSSRVHTGKAVLKVITWKSRKLNYINYSKITKASPWVLRQHCHPQWKAPGKLCATALGLIGWAALCLPCFLEATLSFLCSQFSISQETQILKHTLPMHIYTPSTHTHLYTERKGEGPPWMETVWWELICSRGLAGPIAHCPETSFQATSYHRIL